MRMFQVVGARLYIDKTVTEFHRNQGLARNSWKRQGAIGKFVGLSRISKLFYKGKTHALGP
jgi:hypothetical protein